MIKIFILVIVTLVLAIPEALITVDFVNYAKKSDTVFEANVERMNYDKMLMEGRNFKIFDDINGLSNEIKGNFIDWNAVGKKKMPVKR